MKKIVKIALLAAVVPMFAACCNNTETKSVEDAVIETIMARRSIRAYTDEVVPRETIDKILECGINAPSAMNNQSWEIRVVDNAEYINAVSDILVSANPQFADRPGFKNMFNGAPTLIFVAKQDDFRFAEVDCGLLGENICIAAQAMGLGTCVMAGALMVYNTPEGADYLAKLNLPEGYSLSYCIGLGYPDEAPDARPRNAGKIQYIEF